MRDASYSNGEFVMKRGKAYRLDGTITAVGSVYGPTKIGTSAHFSKRLNNGKATIAIPSSAKAGSHWKVIVKVGSKKYTVKVHVSA